MKNKIIDLLKATERERIENVIEYLENKSDYFTLLFKICSENNSVKRGHQL